MSVPSAPAAATDALLAFQHAYEASVPFREDRVLGADLAAEVEPVLEALQVAYGVADPSQASSRHVHEAYALLTLLSRRAAMLGATPSAALALVGALAEALSVGGVAVSDAVRLELSMVVVEGYSAGSEERVTQELKRIAAESQVWIALAPGCFAAFLGGRHEPETVGAVLDEVSRVLLRGGAASCLLDISRLLPCQSELARHVVGFCATNTSIGVRTLVFGAAPELREPLEALGLVPSGGQLAAGDFEKARNLVLAWAGQEIRPRRRWPTEFFARQRDSGR